LAGTPRYMAPESYRDEKCTEKIDIYSLAMMVWEMLTGQLPWDGWNFQVLHLHLHLYLYLYLQYVYEHWVLLWRA
jgi:serine/threonine protein kinase